MNSFADSSNISDGHFCMGEGCLKVPVKLFANNRQRLAEALGAKVVEKGKKRVVLLEGGSDQGLCKGDSSDYLARGKCHQGVYLFEMLCAISM